MSNRKMTQRVPPWSGGPAKTTRDYMTSEDGAHRLAGMIRKAWAKVGVTIQTHVSPVRAKDGDVLCWTVIMPTLVNGLPVGDNGSAP